MDISFACRSTFFCINIVSILYKWQNRDRPGHTRLQSGAADYVVKQFSPMELAVRIGAVLRQRSGIGYVGQP